MVMVMVMWAFVGCRAFVSLGLIKPQKGQQFFLSAGFGGKYHNMYGIRSQRRWYTLAKWGFREGWDFWGFWGQGVSEAHAQAQASHPEIGSVSLPTAAAPSCWQRCDAPCVLHLCPCSYWEAPPVKGFEWYDTWVVNLSVEYVNLFCIGCYLPGWCWILFVVCFVT